MGGRGVKRESSIESVGLNCGKSGFGSCIAKDKLCEFGHVSSLYFGLASIKIASEILW